MYMASFNARLVRKDIPELRNRQVNNHPLTYLDSAASTLPPDAVIDAMSRYYQLRHANVHRGVYQTAVEATEAYENARSRVARFINAAGPHELIFTKNTTESINLIARSWGATHLRAGDIVVLSEMEHHANIIPWLQLKEALGIELRFIPVGSDFRLDLSTLDELLSGAALLSITAMSNVLGTKNPVSLLSAAAHQAGALVAVDAAQSIIHGPTDVKGLDVDFLSFSAHKMLGPTGIGALWVQESVLDSMPPFLGGGGMISDVTTTGFTPAAGVARFEAGTPPIAEAAGLDAAIRYLEGLSMVAVASHDRALTEHALSQLNSFGDRIHVIGPPNVTERGGVISLEVVGVHPHDVTQILDQFGVCARPGHHCAKPLMRRFGLSATTRVSFGPYSLYQDIDVLIEALGSALQFFEITKK